MSAKVRIKSVVIDAYYFIGYNGLYWHSGCFWFNGEKVKEVYNNGSKAILLYGCTKKSIRKLRQQAQPCKIELFNNII